MDDLPLPFFSFENCDYLILNKMCCGVFFWLVSGFGFVDFFDFVFSFISKIAFHLS